MIAYVIMRQWTKDALLDDMTWGDSDIYWERAEVFTCRVAAQRRMAPYLRDGWEVAVCPWEIPSSEAEDTREWPAPLSSNVLPTVASRTLFDGF